MPNNKEIAKKKSLVGYVDSYEYNSRWWVKGESSLRITQYCFMPTLWKHRGAIRDPIKVRITIEEIT